MKFDFAIGNPPYQDESVGDNKTFKPLMLFITGLMRMSSRPNESGQVKQVRRIPTKICPD